MTNYHKFIDTSDHDLWKELSKDTLPADIATALTCREMDILIEFMVRAQACDLAKLWLTEHIRGDEKDEIDNHHNDLENLAKYQQKDN